MATEIKVPALGESVTEATVAKWFKAPGESVGRDEPLVEIETDKVTLEVNAPSPGVLTEILVPAGGTVQVGGVLGLFGEAGASASGPGPAKPASPAAAPAAAGIAERSGPAVRKLLAETGAEGGAIAATGKDGRLTKGDVLTQLAGAPVPIPRQAAVFRQPAEMPAPESPPSPPVPVPGREQRVRMTRLRKRIAERLKQAQNTAAILTTFNEIDMSAAAALRERYRDAFEKRHGVKLGFMSFFVKAAIVALKELPAVNAEIDGDDLVYKNYYDIGVAVGTEQGLVVPVLRDADRLGFAEIETGIADLGRRAREGKLGLDELTGGTFTITNGGIYGSLMSTPILNPPQSGILGMHKIEKRPVAAGDKIEIRPMMYVALSYDHRVIDGREAVTFLVRVKECIENPERLLLNL